MRVRALLAKGRLKRGTLGSLGPAGIWLSSLALAMATVAILMLPLAGADLTPTLELPFIALVGAFVLAEVMVVHVHFNRNAHSMSLSEIATVVGLYAVADPVDLVMAHALGASLVLVVYRRQAPFRLAFNVAMMAFTSACVLLVFNAILSGPGLHSDEVRWFAAAVSIVVGALVGACAVLGAICVVEREVDLRAFPRGAGLAAASALANTGIGLLIVALAETRPAALALLVIPTVVLFLTYRAYTEEREKHQSTELLYESTLLLNEGREFDAAAVALLTRARSTFRAEVTQLLLPSPDGDFPARRTQVGPGDSVETLRPVPISLEEEPWAGLAASGSPILLAATTPEDQLLARELLQLDLRGAMVAPLMDEGRVLGFLAVGGRLGQLGSFQAVDFRLFSLVAAQLAAALEHGRLERSLAQLEALERELSHRAHHDPLTGLANRDAVPRPGQLGARPGRPPLGGGLRRSGRFQDRQRQPGPSGRRRPARRGRPTDRPRGA